MDDIRKLEIEALQTEHIQHEVLNGLADIEPELLRIREEGVKGCFEQGLVIGCLSYVLGVIHLRNAQNLLEEMKILDEDENNG